MSLRKQVCSLDLLTSLKGYQDNTSIIILTDATGGLLHTNASGLTYFNCSIAELQDQNLFDYVREDGHGVLSSLYGLGTFPQPKVFTGLYLQGLDRSVTLRYYHLPSLELSVFMFVTPNLQEEEIQHQEERKWAERLQVMLFGMNHELKTPLATTRGYLELMELEGSEHTNYIKASLEALQKMSEILNNMTEPMRALVQGSTAKIELSDAVRSYTKTMDYMEPTKRYVGLFEAHIEEGRGCYVDIPRTRFYQVLTNLFDNAIRATAHLDTEADIQLEINPCTKPHHDQCVVLSFSDNGVGMDEETARKMFVPYFTTRDEDTGSGLGSYLVYQFVHDAGGRIDLETELGKGTTLRLHLPYTKEDPHGDD